MVTIEIEFLNRGAPIALNASLVELAIMANQLRKLDSDLATTVCPVHLQLPRAERKFIAGRWVAEISCCCLELSERVMRKAGM